MAIDVTCSCGKALKLKDELAGKRIRCPACSQPLTVPSGAAEQPASMPAAESPAESEAGDNEPIGKKAKGKKDPKKSRTMLYVAIGGGVLLLSCCCLGGVGGIIALWVSGGSSSKVLPAPPVEEKSKWVASDPLYARAPGQIGSISKSYTIPLKAGKAYTIDLVKTGGMCDPYLVLEDQSGKRLASDDDGGGNLNARILFTPTQDGDYRIIALTIAGVGDFTLSVKEAAARKEGGPANDKKK